jgi:hippurate hydrolase
VEQRGAALDRRPIIAANWKITQEAFCEAFHVNATHPQILPYIGEEEAFRKQDHQRAVVVGERTLGQGIVRSLSPEVREAAPKWIEEVLRGMTQSFGATYTLTLTAGAPVTMNHPELVSFAIPTLESALGKENVIVQRPQMGAEDFAYMLEARPGAFIFCGNGDTAGLHHPEYNFNDEAIVHGTSYWIKLVENALAA